MLQNFKLNKEIKEAGEFTTEANSRESEGKEDKQSV
jgi:hypothetical protein